MENGHSREQVLHENRLLHRFGNGLHIRDVYDDALNRRLIFILPHGKELRAWWFGSKHHGHGDGDGGVKRLFDREDAMKQELILKKVMRAILVSLKRIHDAGYIHHDIKPPNILVTRRSGAERRVDGAVPVPRDRLRDVCAVRAASASSSTPTTSASARSATTRGS